MMSTSRLTGVPGPHVSQRRQFERVRHEVDVEAPPVDAVDGEADAVDADRTLAGDVARQLVRDLELHPDRARVVVPRDDDPHAVDMAR